MKLLYSESSGLVTCWIFMLKKRVLLIEEACLHIYRKPFSLYFWAMMPCVPRIPVLLGSCSLLHPSSLFLSSVSYSLFTVYFCIPLTISGYACLFNKSVAFCVSTVRADPATGQSDPTTSGSWCWIIAVVAFQISQLYYRRDIASI